MSFSWRQGPIVSTGWLWPSWELLLSSSECWDCGWLPHNVDLASIFSLLMLVLLKYLTLFAVFWDLVEGVSISWVCLVYYCLTLLLSPHFWPFRFLWFLPPYPMVWTDFDFIPLFVKFHWFVLFIISFLPWVYFAVFLFLYVEAWVQR